MPGASMLADGDLATATRAVTDAIAAAGGTVTSQLPGQPIQFIIKGGATDKWYQRYDAYDGVTRLTAVANGQTRIDPEVKPTPAAVALLIVFPIVVILIFGYPPGIYQFNLILFFAVIGVCAWGCYVGLVMWPQELLSRVAAEYPARTCPCQRFDAALAGGSA